VCGVPYQSIMHKPVLDSHGVDPSMSPRNVDGIPYQDGATFAGCSGFIRTCALVIFVIEK